MQIQDHSCEYQAPLSSSRRKTIRTFFRTIKYEKQKNIYKHVLRTFDNSTIHFEKIRTFQSFETKVVVFEVFGVVNNVVDKVFVLHRDFPEFLGNERTRFSRSRIHISAEKRGEMNKN